MELVSAKKLEDFMKRVNQSRTVLRTWKQLVEGCNWKSFHDLRNSCPQADQAGRFVVFDVRGDKYRVIAEPDYQNSRITIRHVFDHAEYDDWCKKNR